MQAQTHTPAAIFGSHIRYVVPLFQRRYVWDKTEQSAPLWDDVRALAEKVLDTPSGYGAPPVSPHFLGVPSSSTNSRILRASSRCGTSSTGSSG